MSEHIENISKTITQVRKELDKLGIKGDTFMQEINGDSDKLQVYAGGKYIGVFDTARNTFVD